MDIIVTDPDKIWELRLYLGDLGDIEQGEDQFLSDEAYQYFITKYTKPDGTYYFRSALMSAGISILAQLAGQGARQRVGQEEIYGKELVDSWVKFLQMLQKGKYQGGGSPTIYVGGVLREATAFYARNPEFIDSPFYRGQQARTPYWDRKRLEFWDTVVEPEERRTLYPYSSTP